MSHLSERLLQRNSCTRNAIGRHSTRSRIPPFAIMTRPRSRILASLALFAVALLTLLVAGSGLQSPDPSTWPAYPGQSCHAVGPHARVISTLVSQIWTGPSSWWCAGVGVVKMRTPLHADPVLPVTTPDRHNHPPSPTTTNPPSPPRKPHSGPDSGILGGVWGMPPALY